MQNTLDIGWAIVGNPTNNSIDKLYDFLRKHNIKPKEFMCYGDIRTFIRASELPETEAIAFHHGVYIGILDDVETYINEFKRTDG
jgi:hypothetical protein